MWDDMERVSLDHEMIEYLFEYRGKDASSLAKDSKQMSVSANREIIVLDHKRSNAINIGMTKLPPPRIIREQIQRCRDIHVNPVRAT